MHSCDTCICTMMYYSKSYDAFFHPIYFHPKNDENDVVWSAESVRERRCYCLSCSYSVAFWLNFIHHYTSRLHKRRPTATTGPMYTRCNIVYLLRGADNTETLNLQYTPLDTHITCVCVCVSAHAELLPEHNTSPIFFREHLSLWPSCCAISEHHPWNVSNHSIVTSSSAPNLYSSGII